MFTLQLHKMNSSLNKTAFVILIVGAVIMVGTFVFLPFHNVVIAEFGDSPDFEVTGGIGDFIGGVVGTLFSLAGTLFVVLTLQDQRLQNKREHFTQTFYEMLHIHCDNVKDMVIRLNDNTNIEGRKVFTKLISDFNNTYSLVDDYISSIQNGAIRDEEWKTTAKRYLSENNNRERLTLRLAYGYFFFGTNRYWLHEGSEIEQKIDAFVRNKIEGNNLHVSSHNALLGHYYRHLFQMVTMVSAQKHLTEDERYSYVKQLRAQLDDEEQLLLYYNAMSDIGKDWLKGTCNIRENMKVEEMCPMARFRLIKNIPSPSSVKGVSPIVQFQKEIVAYEGLGLSFFEIAVR